MLTTSPASRVWLAAGATGLRAGFDRLCILAQSVLGQQASSGHLFVYCNASCTRVRILYFDGTGLWLLTNSHAPQCAFWFILEDFLSISPAVRERLRDVRLCRWGTGHGLCAFG